MKSELRSFGRSLIGDKAFYLKVLTLTLPIALQNGLVNVVGMLDNIMVGQLGTNEMSGVSISNNLLFILTMLFLERYRQADFLARSISEKVITRE